MRHRFFPSGLRHSVTAKYSFGYLLLSVIAAVLLLLSFFSSYFISTRYRNMTDELLKLNELYVNVEDINSAVNINYLYLRIGSYEEYQNECEKAQTTMSQIRKYMEGNYTREIINTLYTVETYMEQTEELMDALKVYIGSTDRNLQTYQDIEALYAQTQVTLDFVNSSFQSAYSHKLIAVQQTQQRIEGLQRILELTQITLLIIGCSFCLLYCVKIIKGITLSMKKLTSAVEKIERDVYEEIHIEIDSRDEFEDFGKALNHMLAVIQTQMRKIEENANIKEQLAEVEIENLRIYGELQKSQLTLLQSRINPHFLFNTLNMISSLARMEQAERSADLMEITATYLRYNLDNLSKSVTLSQEIDNLKNYVFIQQNRFENRYAYVFEIDDLCWDYLMPLMILQPLVENAIKHGLAMRTQGGIITIRVYCGGSKIYLETEDNGEGMSPERVEEVQNSLADNTVQDEHIGLRNIYMRLQYFYKGEAELHIRSGETGTTIQIVLPFKKDGEEC